MAPSDTVPMRGRLVVGGRSPIGLSWRGGKFPTCRSSSDPADWKSAATRKTPTKPGTSDDPLTHPFAVDFQLEPPRRRRHRERHPGRHAVREALDDAPAGVEDPRLRRDDLALVHHL